MIKTRSIGLMLGAVLMTSAITPAFANEDPVVAKVNGEDIHRSALEQIRAAVPYLKDVPLEHVYDALLENVISLTLVAEEARKDGLLEDPTVKRNIVAAERQILRSVYLNKEIEKKVSDDQLKADYKVWLKDNPPQDQIHARHILLKTEKEAVDVIKELDGGADFETLAKAKSTGPSAPSGGDLGYFVAKDMVPSFSEAAFALKKGEYTKKPVKTQFGWHVIKTEDRRKVDAATFEEVKPKLYEKAAMKMAAEIEKKLLDKAEIERFNMDGSAKK